MSIYMTYFRPRKMLPLLIGIPQEEDEASEESSESENEVKNPFSDEEKDSKEGEKSTNLEDKPRRHPKTLFEQEEKVEKPKCE